MLLSSFAIIAHVFLSISGRFCVKLILNTSNSSAYQTLGHESTWILATVVAAMLESAADPNLTSEKLRVRLVPWFTFPIVGMYILDNILTSFDKST